MDNKSLKKALAILNSLIFMKLQVIILLSFFIVFINSCRGSNKKTNTPKKELLIQKNEDKKNLPASLQHLENLKVYPTNTQAPDTVVLKKTHAFGTNEDIFIKGLISKIAIDKRNRVFIAASSPDNAGIYIFDSKGTYLTTIGRFGRGPGEFESIGSLQITNNKLYIFDPRLQKYSIFSLTDFSHIKDYIIKRDRIKNVNSLALRLNVEELFAYSKNSLLLRLSDFANKEIDIAKIAFYRSSADGFILPGSILELNRFSFYYPQKTERRIPILPITMPFTRGSLISITSEGEFFTAWTEDFLIKKYDKNGNYERAFYYPVNKSSLSLEEFDLSNFQEKVLNNYEMPKTWQALHTMELDDEGRLWIAVITNDKKNFKWWVLDKKGKLLARFTFPGKRSNRSTFAPRFNIEIKNGYFYITKKDKNTGLKSIKCYKIAFVQQ